MPTQPEEGEVEFLKGYLSHFETTVYPLFAALGISRNSALMTYTILCGGGCFTPADDEEDESWKN